MALSDTNHLIQFDRWTKSARDHVDRRLYVLAASSFKRAADHASALGSRAGATMCLESARWCKLAADAYRENPKADLGTAPWDRLQLPT